MATEKYVSQANFEHVWGNLSAMLDKKVSTNDSRLSDARVPRAHTHGNISNVGAITNTAVTVASGDSLLVGDASANNVIVKSSIAFGSGTTTYLRNDGTWGTPTNTTYSDMKGATASAAGTHGLVPAPAAGAQAKYLRGDGTWASPPNDNTTYEVFTGASSTADGSTGLVPKPSKGDQAKYLRADGVWASPANTDTKVTNTLATTTKAYVTGTTTATTNTGTQVFDTGVYLDTTAGSLVATKFVGALTGNADSSTKATNDSLNNPITEYVKSLSVNGRTITITKGDGTTSTITTQDNDHIYNNFTGATSTAGGKNGLVPAPAVGQQDKFLKADGTWATPVDTNDKVTNTLNTAVKAYLTGTTSDKTNTGTQVFDTGVYITANAGELHADKFVGAVTGNASSATKATNDAKDQAITGYIRSLSVSGKVITYTKGDGTTGTITTQDTNTWRNIQNNLTSDSTTDSLAAAQGKVLKGLIDGKADASHTHVVADITDFPESMPASDVADWAKAETKPTYTKSEVGLGNVDNTADKDKSVKAATSATNDSKSQAITSYIRGLSISGRTITVTKGDGTTSTLTTQDNNTTYNDVVGATADAAGTHGLVPAPAKGVTTQYLKSTGAWAAVAWGEISGKPSTFTPAEHTHNYAGSSSSGGSATSAVKLDTATAGSATQPVYFTGGKPTACTYTLGKSVPSDAVFTDHTYSVFSAATADAAGSTGLVPAPTKGQQAYYLAGDSTWKAFSKSTVGLGNVDNTADANKSVKYATTAGAATNDSKSQAITSYIRGLSISGTTITYTKGDGTTGTLTTTNTWRGIQNNLTSTATDQSLSAAQGKILNESKATMTVLSNEDLDKVTTPGFYNAGGGNTCANKPTGYDNFGMIVTHNASGAYYTQIIFDSNGVSNRRTCANGTWGSWAQDKLTDTKDWNSITGKPSTFTPASHTHKYASGFSVSGQTVTVTYGDGTTSTFKTQDTNTDTKVTNTLNTTAKAYITGTTTATTNTGTQVFDTGVYLDTTAGMLTATTFKGALSGNASSATKATNDSKDQAITGYVRGLTINGRTITVTKGDGTTSTLTTQDTNTDTKYDNATTTTAGLMSPTDKVKVDGIWNTVSISKSLTLTTNWQDTGIAGTNLDSGTYIIQVSGLTTNSNGFYSEVYSGIMTWYNGTTNSTTADEIPLHNAGHADNSNEIYLRTIRNATSDSSTGYLKLQIAAKAAGTKADTIVFKFRRMI